MNIEAKTDGAFVVMCNDEPITTIVTEDREVAKAIMEVMAHREYETHEIQEYATYRKVYNWWYRSVVLAKVSDA